MPILSMPVINSVACVALFVMWLEDRRRRYLLWWGIAQLAMLSAYIAGVANFYLGDENSLYAALIAGVSMSCVFFAFNLGALNYRKPTPAPALLKLSSVGLLALMILLYLHLDSLHWPFMVGAVAMVITMLNASLQLWSGEIMERFTSAFFLIRACGLSLVLVVLASEEKQQTLRNVTGIYSAVMSIITVTLLLLICYRRSQREMRSHLNLLSLSHDILTSLPGVHSVSELGDRIIPRLVQQHGWDGGALIEIDRATGELELASVHGSQHSAYVRKGMRLPVDRSVSGKAVKTKCVQIINDPSLINHQNPEQSGSTNPMTIVAIPLLHDGEANGAFMLGAEGKRDISPQELVLFETLSHVGGLSLANVQHMYSLTETARLDSLTGLGNRVAYHEFVFRSGTAVTQVMLFDLDHFKEINDTLGHGVGDKVLKELARRLAEALEKKHARVFRLGGDEFVVVYLESSKTSRELAVRLRELMRAPMLIEDVSLIIDASIGAVEPGAEANDSHELLRRADLAMYEAKKHRSAFAIYDEDTDNKVRERVELLADVHHALENDHFQLHYQPLIDLNSGETLGVEALLRWNHHSRGLLSAGTFMPYVEATEQIRALTYRVIHIAMRDMRDWRHQGIDLKLSLNLSTRNLFDLNLPDYLDKHAQARGINPANIQLEITETVLMTDPEISLSVLQRLRDLGFEIALDDFGTGYSSLSYLARFPINTLKIDRSFVSKILDEPQSRSIVESTIDLSHRLGTRVTAEGIENKETADLLATMKCESGQGYYFSEPLPAAELLDWLRTHDASKVTGGRLITFPFY